MTAPTPPAEQAPRSSGRLLFIDLVRAVTVLLMVQGHTLHVLLAHRWHASWPFRAWLFVRGLTAPTFFTLAGFSLASVTLRRFAPPHAGLRRSAGLQQPRPRVWSVAKRLLRFGGFLLLGYALHFPVHKLSALRRIDRARWQSFFVVDVLQMLAVALTLLQLLGLAAPGPALLAGCSVVLALSFVALTPAMRAVDWLARLPAPLAAFLYAGSGSIFPLFGWACFPFAGAALAAGHHWQAERDRGLLLRRGLELAAILVGAGLLLWIPFRAHFSESVLDPYPPFYLVRMGCVTLVLAVAERLSRGRDALPPMLQALSEESLTIYFLHLCLLYGSIWGDGMWQFVGPRLPPLPTFGWVLVFLSSMTLIAFTWNRIKRRWPRGKHLLRAGFVAVLIWPLL